MTVPLHTTGFVAVRSTASRTPLDALLAAELAAAVRATRHGILVASERPPDPEGTFVQVQPCDERQRPVRAAVRVGPLETADDVDELCVWLRAGLLDPATLPLHLLGVTEAIRRS
ncbi:hypothetical protein [Pseudonocardia sp. T1-2H]|uniref:hypothetical protein n=1 Tax=Pseudonocardia sp. T1-2H TaxID=3128899 RepID=UPI003100AA5F